MTGPRTPPPTVEDRFGSGCRRVTRRGRSCWTCSPRTHPISAPAGQRRRGLPAAGKGMGWFDHGTLPSAVLPPA